MYTAKEYLFAESIEEAAQLVRKNPRNVVLGGGTFLRLGHKQIHTLIDLTRLEMNKIDFDEGEVALGASVTLRMLETDEALLREFPVLATCVQGIVGVQFRACATLGASVYSRYGFSDIITALLALDAEVELFGAGRMTLAAFLNDKPRRDILTRVFLPRRGRRVVYGTIRRAKTDFGILNVCVSKAGMGDCRVSVGARPGVAMRCPEAEVLLNAGDVEGACNAVRALTYGDNARASAAYRRDMSAVLLRRAARELCGEEDRS